MTKRSISELRADKIDIENEIARLSKTLKRAKSMGNEKLVNHLEEEIGILNVDLEHVDEDIAKMVSEWAV